MKAKFTSSQAKLISKPGIQIYKYTCKSFFSIKIKINFYQNQNKFILNLDQCFFYQNQAKFLSHINSDQCFNQNWTKFLLKSKPNSQI